MTTLSPRASRALALALFVGLVLSGVFGVILPLLDAYQQACNSAEQRQAAVEHIRQSARSLAVLQAELTRLKEQQASAVGFMQSTNPSLAAAEVQNRIKSSVEAARGELRSTQILPARDEAGFRRISIRGQIAVNTAALQRVFYELESGSPFLFLDNVEIHARPARRGGPAEDDPILEVRFDLYGYLRRAT